MEEASRVCSLLCLSLLLATLSGMYMQHPVISIVFTIIGILLVLMSSPS